MNKTFTGPRDGSPIKLPPTSFSRRHVILGVGALSTAALWGRPGFAQQATPHPRWPPIAVVTLGDSITDGTGSTPDANRRWPDSLAARLVNADAGAMAVLNEDIGGNRVLHDAFFTEEGEATRQEVNEWIRTGGAYDAVIDFDAVVRDPGNPTRVLPAYDAGDYLHINDAGYQAMAESIDLMLFSRR